jgi:hypothetical protein
MQCREAFDTTKAGKSTNGTLAIKVISEYSSLKFRMRKQS